MRGRCFPVRLLFFQLWIFRRYYSFEKFNGCLSASNWLHPEGNNTLCVFTFIRQGSAQVVLPSPKRTRFLKLPKNDPVRTISARESGLGSGRGDPLRRECAEPRRDLIPGHFAPTPEAPGQGVPKAPGRRSQLAPSVPFKSPSRDLRTGLREYYSRVLQVLL